MAELNLFKREDGSLFPLDQQSSDIIKKFKVNQGFQADVKKHNNPQFHRKLFALFNLAFEAWTPEEVKYKGEIIQKNFDQFRKDITILAGFGEPIFNFKGELRYVAKSLNFSAMPHEEREKLYSAIIDVILQRILTKYSREDIEDIVNQVLEFA